MVSFGSVHEAFQKLDVDKSGHMNERDFCREVYQAGFVGNASAVFAWLEKDRRIGDITIREFSRLMELKYVWNAC